MNAIELKLRMGVNEFYQSVKWALNVAGCKTIQKAVNYLFWAHYNNQ